jgi:F-type H+-transporting ATPase subunit epsilon
MPFQCTVVTPEQQALDESVQQAILPAHDGLIGILAGHSPLLVKLGIGPLRIDLPSGQRRYYFIEGGVAQMKEDRLTILTSQAIPADELDAETARAEYAEAVARRPTDAKSHDERQRQLRRASVKQELAGRR